MNDRKIVAKDRWKIQIRRRSNRIEICPEKTGEITKIPLSTTELATLEWLEFIEKVEHFVFDYFNVNLPKPHNEDYTVY